MRNLILALPFLLLGIIGVQCTHQQLETNFKPALTSPFVELFDSSTVAPDLARGLNFRWVLLQTGRGLGNPMNVSPSLIGMTTNIYFIQDAIGQRNVTQWGEAYRFPFRGQHPQLTNEPNAVDRISCFIRAIDALDCTFTPNYL
jgi:hypothetical protein